jgi:hypothetical protein
MNWVSSVATYNALSPFVVSRLSTLAMVLQTCRVAPPFARGAIQPAQLIKARRFLGMAACAARPPAKSPAMGKGGRAVFTNWRTTVERVNQELLAIIRQWGVKPAYMGIVCSIARHWKTPERYEINLRSIYRQSPDWFFGSKPTGEPSGKLASQPTRRKQGILE